MMALLKKRLTRTFVPPAMSPRLRPAREPAMVDSVS